MSLTVVGSLNEDLPAAAELRRHGSSARRPGTGRATDADEETPR